MWQSFFSPPRLLQESSSIFWDRRDKIQEVLSILENWSYLSLYVSLLAPSPPRELSVKLKEGTRLILQWRKPEETNGIIKKYEIHFTDDDGATKTYTSHSDLKKGFLTYEVSLTDVQMEYEIKVWKRYIIIMKGHEKRSKSKAFVVFC